MSVSEEEFQRLFDRVVNLTTEVRSIERELDRRIDDERSDRERADDAIKSDLESLRHDVVYSR